MFARFHNPSCPKAIATIAVLVNFGGNAAAFPAESDDSILQPVPVRFNNTTQKQFSPKSKEMKSPGSSSQQRQCTKPHNSPPQAAHNRQ
jgi:hypothetical protein